MNSDNNCPIYLLDKESGKVYKIPEKLSFTFSEAYFDFINNKIFFVTEVGSEPSIYKLEIQQSQLIIEKLISDSFLIGHYPQIAVDVYNNLYINSAYVMTPDRKLKKTEKYMENWFCSVHKAIDGKIWYEEKILDEDTDEYICKYYYFNENSEAILSEQDPSKMLSFRYFIRDGFEHLKYKDNLDYYYNSSGSSFVYDNEFIDSGHVNGNFVKLSYTSKDKTDFVSEGISWEDSGSNLIYIHDRAYMMNQNEIFYITIRDGKKHLIASVDYILKNISTDGLGNIYFTGVDLNLQNISGVIEYDGTIKTNVTPSEHVVIYISPLN